MSSILRRIQKPPLRAYKLQLSDFSQFLQSEVTAEIELAGDGTVGDFFRRAFKQNFSFVQNVRTIDDMQGLADIVVGYQNSHAAFP